MTTDSDGPF